MPYDKNATLCWECKKASGGCSWSKKFVPVEGWDATPTKVWVGHTSAKPYIDSFHVNECPEFEQIEPCALLDIDDLGKLEKLMESQKFVQALLNKKYQKKKERKK